MADLANEDKPAIAPPVFVFHKDKPQKRSAEGSSAEDGEDSDKDEGSYTPPVKRERTSSFPPPHSVPKNNVFMPSSFCQSPTGNSDSEPGEQSRPLLVFLSQLKGPLSLFLYLVIRHPLKTFSNTENSFFF
uniref:Ran-binding protein 3-like n=1 Tax=Neolamprologus brichardi TaxID=32507 RepID=A0A3Q4H1X9_NEOBR